MQNVYEDYLKLVTDTVEKYSKLSRLIYGNEVNPSELNRALAEYMENNVVLIGEYYRIKLDFVKIQREYQEWYDDKFVETKAEMNKDITGSKKLAVKEYETELRVIFKEEYGEWQEKLITAEMAVNMYRRVVETYKNFDRILVALSSNTRQDMYTLSLENRMNTKPENVSKNRVRKRGIAQD
jgi:hypothetical protein